MAEWSIAPVLKTGDLQGSVGSNPTPSEKPVVIVTGAWFGIGFQSYSLCHSKLSLVGGGNLFRKLD